MTPQSLEDLLQSLDVSLRLLEVRFEGVPQVGIGRGFGQLGQRFRQLFLRVVAIAQFVEKGIVECSCVSHGRFSLSRY